jgi:manganese/zinc/iron transport system ATP- binding protein
MIQQVENPILEIHDLTVSYDKKPVLWNVDLTIPTGKLVGIIGPNGAGKSTLIKAIMGLVPVSSGYVRVFGKDAGQARKQISYVPQRESVDWDFPASVFDVVLMGRYPHLGLFQRPTQADKEIALDCLRKVGLETFQKRQISQLSGGQRQRVFIARALAQQAEVYFLDEPFAGVDAATESAIIELLREMAQTGKTVIVVHHDLQSVQEYFDWVIMLNTRLVASGPTSTAFHPTTINETYGGKLTLLTDVAELMQKKRFPNRETKPRS